MLTFNIQGLIKYTSDNMKLFKIAANKTIVDMKKTKRKILLSNKIGEEKCEWNIMIIIHLHYFCCCCCLFFSFLFVVNFVIHWYETAMGLHVFPIPIPPHLPLHPLPLGLPSAPGPSACLMHPTWAGDLFHPR